MSHKSKIKIFGLPLIHVATGKIVDGRYKRGIAKGWIAIGDISFGILLSLGGVAFGGISFGGLAFGMIAIAGLAIGGFALGGLAIGVIAAGGLAIGIFSFGGCAIALYSARGGAAIAKMYAEGGLAIARHANNEMAKEYFEFSLIFSALQPFFASLASFSRWFSLLFVIPVTLIWVGLKRIKRK